VTGDGSYTVKRYIGAKPFSNFARVIEFQSSAKSTYNGATIELNKRFSHNWEAKLAYTLSRATDTKTDATAVVPQSSDDAKFASDPQNFEADNAPGDNDVRHRIVFSGLWNLPNPTGIKNEVALWFLSGWTLSGVVSFQTGAPYSLEINGDLNNDGNTRNDRVPGTGRNQERLPSLLSVDPRISKHIPVGPVDLEIIVEAFNVFNAHNVIGLQSVQYRFANGVLTPNTAFLTPCTGGQGCTAAIAASTGPRIVQLAGRVTFSRRALGHAASEDRAAVRPELPERADRQEAEPLELTAALFVEIERIDRRDVRTGRRPGDRPGADRPRELDLVDLDVVSEIEPVAVGPLLE